MRTLFLLLVFLPTSCAAKQITTMSSSKYELWKSGALRGANLWQKRIHPGLDGDSLGKDKIGPPYLQSDFDQLAKLGANWVNLSVPGIFSEHSPYGLDPDAMRNLETLVERAAKADLFVVISFRTGPGRDENAIIHSSKGLHLIWKSLEAQNAWVEMWKTAAMKFKSAPNVVGFNLMVEPNSNEALHAIDSPSDFYPKLKDTLTDWNPILNRLVLEIRKIDELTPILLEPLNYADPKWASFLDIPQNQNLVLAVHYYAPYKYTHQRVPLKLKYGGKSDWSDSGKKEILNKAWLEKSYKGIAEFKKKSNLPVTVNEWGAMRFEPGVRFYYRDSFEVLESQDVSHALWLWESSYPGISYDEFNFRKDAALLDTIRLNWKRNGERPSTLNPHPSPSPR